MEKYIHYCWFGGNKLPKLAKKCIKSWKKYLPDYKIIEWNEKNFDVNITEFSKKAYEEKKWAFVSDVARVYALKEMGGIYLDTDMMIKKPVDETILEKDFFVGWESDINIAVGVLGAVKGNKIVEELFEKYKKTEFNSENIYKITIPRLLTDLLKKEYKMKVNHLENQVLKGNTYILARDYFYPISSDRSLDDMFTKNTCMIHYYSGTWLPRDQQIQAIFEQKFGRKNGKRILNVLIKIKHGLRHIKKVTKDVLRIVLYPAVKIRRIVRKNRMVSSKKQRIDQKLAKINKDYLVFYHEDWIGIKTATKELFPNVAISISDLDNEEIVEYYAKAIVNKNPRLLIFSGFATGWEDLIKIINEQNKNIVIKIIWHGSMCMNIYDYDYIRFTKMFELLKQNKIKSIAFVKKSMFEFFKQKGYNVEFLANNIKNLKTSKKQGEKQNNEKIKVGIYASGDRWVKNFYNQLAAASLIDNCVVDCIPINYKAYGLAELFDIDIKGISTQVEHNQILNRMAKNDVNMYITFSECAPMIPLESLELGVPCITSNNHHYFAGTPLEEYLIVRDVDNINAIYLGLKKALENKEKIIEEYKKWKETYNIEAVESLNKFLEV